VRNRNAKLQAAFLTLPLIPDPSHAVDSVAAFDRSYPRRAAAVRVDLNFGPQHPATHTTFRLVLKLDGERVLDAMPDIGYSIRL